jgi:hypothetical protein
MRPYTAVTAAATLAVINMMSATQYRREFVYDPLIPYIWIMLDKLDKKGLLIPKLRPAAMPQPSNQSPTK